MSYPYEEVEAAIVRFRDAIVESEKVRDWAWLGETFYTDDCVYICNFGGINEVVATGGKEIGETHLGGLMDIGSGWAGWTFPIFAWAINGDQIIARWVGRGPGQRPDGSYYEQQGVSLITYGGNGKFSHQIDLFDFAHQMTLCIELEEAGLLNPKLKEEWVVPSCRQLIARFETIVPQAAG